LPPYCARFAATDPEARGLARAIVRERRGPILHVTRIDLLYSAGIDAQADALDAAGTDSVLRGFGAAGGVPTPQMPPRCP
jgi:hypothetical protein